MKAQGILLQHIFLTASVLLATAGFSQVVAQNMTPLTGALLQEPVHTVNPAAPTATPAALSAAAYPQTATVAAAPAQSSTTAVPPERRTGVRIGDVTHTLLQAQADGRVAGTGLPMLGATADVSWERYLESFRHPLPEFYDNKVTKKQSD
ncbi:putative exported protein [Collimonas arenae]|uniref:Putative exported protein n=1 Tax=Collimonas arenae TaxID=279058 RepID=A0A0A1F5X7_9BURK|nr:DUF3613 domain-containing protein [Collimonas arenae]AIY40113.1 putative exported protein [Collimonas arenae]